MMQTNHRPERRSYRTCGSDVPLVLPPTEAKKLSVVVLRDPITPDLLNTRILPLATAITCVGPTAPIESGGMYPESLSCMARKFAPIVCGLSAEAGALMFDGQR